MFLNGSQEKASNHVIFTEMNQDLIFLRKIDGRPKNRCVLNNDDLSGEVTSEGQQEKL